MLSLRPVAQFVVSFFIASLGVFSLNVVAESEVKAPLDIPGTIKVEAEDIITLVSEIPDLIIIDARVREDRRQGYIESSINLPDTETNCETLAEIIPDSDSSVLFYCNGVKCGRSVVSSRQALACGYKNIYWFRGGYEEWKAKDFPVLKP